MYLLVQPKPHVGQIAYAPSSLLATELAVLIASLAEGTSVIYGDLRCHDTLILQDACQAMGATIHSYPDRLEITGVAGQIRYQRKNLHCRRAALVFHIMTALASYSRIPMVFNADVMLHRYALSPFLEALKQLGAAIEPIDISHDIPLIHWGGGIDTDVCDLPGDISHAGLIAMIFMATLAPTPILLRIHGKLAAQSALMQTVSMLAYAGIMVETDEALSLIRVYPSLAKASHYQLYSDYHAATPLLLLFALHPGSYEIHQLRSYGLPEETHILRLFTDMGLSFHQDEVTPCLQVNNTQQRMAGHYQLYMPDYPELALLLVVLSAFIRGRVRIMGVTALREEHRWRLDNLLLALDKLGVIFTLTRKDSCIDTIDIIGAASYQGGLVFENITDATVFMGLVIASTRCRQANYFTYDDTLEGFFPDFVVEMQRLGIRCEWVSEALQVQPYWLTAS